MLGTPSHADLPKSPRAIGAAKANALFEHFTRNLGNRRVIVEIRPVGCARLRAAARDW